MLNEVKMPGLPWKAVEQGIKEFKKVSKLGLYKAILENPQDGYIPWEGPEDTLKELRRC